MEILVRINSNVTLVDYTAQEIQSSILTNNKSEMFTNITISGKTRNRFSLVLKKIKFVFPCFEINENHLPILGCLYCSKCYCRWVLYKFSSQAFRANYLYYIFQSELIFGSSKIVPHDIM